MNKCFQKKILLPDDDKDQISITCFYVWSGIWPKAEAISTSSNILKYRSQRKYHFQKMILIQMKGTIKSLTNILVNEYLFCFPPYPQNSLPGWKNPIFRAFWIGFTLGLLFSLWVASLVTSCLTMCTCCNILTGQGVLGFHYDHEYKVKCQR